MKITNEFTVHTPIERAWAVLTDLEGIAPCLPGAQLTGVDGDTYSGKVKVKVGPVVSDFAGTARFVEKDDAAHRAVIDAKGRDARSAGNAAALVTAQLRADGDRTVVSVDTDLKISGKLAQFGSGMIKEVSGKLLGQFVTNLEAKLAAEPAPAATSGLAVGAADAGAGAAPGAADSGGGVPVGAGTVTAGSPGNAETSGALGNPETPFDVAASASAVHGSATRVVPAQDAEPAALDLLELAGGSVYKRMIPLGVGAVVVAAVIVWFVARR
jgi:carbon monoxide dehydrogenase subunit G